MNGRAERSCSEAGDIDATAQSLLIAGERTKDFDVVKQAFSLWNSFHLPLCHIRALARGIIEADKKENPQFYT